jgi:hypothetical protein
MGETMSNLGKTRLSEQPYWTDADASELVAVVSEFLRCLREHRARCARCQAERRTGWPCPRPEQALNEVLAWRDHRRLLSRAQCLRLLHDREDARSVA